MLLGPLSCTASPVASTIWVPSTRSCPKASTGVSPSLGSKLPAPSCGANPGSEADPESHPRIESKSTQQASVFRSASERIGPSKADNERARERAFGATVDCFRLYARDSPGLQKKSRLGSLHITPDSEGCRCFRIDTGGLPRGEVLFASCSFRQVGPLPQRIGDEAAGLENVVHAGRVDRKFAQGRRLPELAAQTPRPEPGSEAAAERSPKWASR